MPSIEEFLQGGGELESTADKILAPNSEKVLAMAKKAEELHKAYLLEHNGECFHKVASRLKVRRSGFCLCEIPEYLKRVSRDLAKVEEAEKRG